MSGEKALLDPKVESKGVEDILAALTKDEKDELADANMPLRHFRAEKGDTKQAIAKIKGTLKWRREFNVKRIITCFDNDDDKEMQDILKRENETGKIYVRGCDKEGRAAMYMRPHRENTHEEENNMRHLVYNLERAIACTSQRTSQSLEKIILLIDYDGYRLRDTPPLSTSRYTLDILQKHYPERMYRAYVLNPPMVFRTFWTIIRPFLDPVTKEKIVFCASAKDGTEKVTQRFDLSNVEPCAFGSLSEPKFDSKEYLKKPFNTTF